MTPPTLSVVIVAYRSRDVIEACLDSVAAALHAPGAPSAEVVVLDACSGDGLVEHLGATRPGVRAVPLPKNGGFAYGVNHGVRVTTGRLVLLLNPDTLLAEDALTRLVSYLDDQPSAAAVAPALCAEDGTAAISSQRFPTLRQEVARQWSPLARRIGWTDLGDEPALAAGPVDWASGACLLVRRRALEEVGAFDDGYFLYWEETDWCLRAREHGWSIHHLPTVRVTHIGGASAAASGETVRQGRVAAAYVDSRRRYYRKHHGLLTGALVEGVHVSRRAVRAAKRLVGVER